MRKQDVFLRQQFLEKRAEYYAEIHDIKKESAVKSLLNQEITKRKFRSIRNAMNKTSAKKLTNILIPRKYSNVKDAYNAIKNDREEISEWDLVTNENEVEDYMVK